MTKAIMNVISAVSVFTITRYFIKIAPVLHQQKGPQTILVGFRLYSEKG